MNKEQLREDLQEFLNTTPTSAHQDFTTAQLDKALNRARLREVNLAKMVGVKNHFLTRRSFTWPASRQTYTLPTFLQREEMYELRDITNGRPGTQLQFSDSGIAGEIYWEDYNTLRWGRSGPGSARTIEMLSRGVGPDMEDDSEEPMFIPPQFHELITWSAAVQLRRASDEMAPPAWSAALNELRGMYHKFVALGKPLSDTPTVRQRESALLSNALPSADSTAQDGTSTGASGQTFDS